MKEVIEILTKNKETISTMESCTGGGLANAITNIEGASEVLQFSAVTYSNEYKIKMGVPKEVIDKYTVYSMETAKAMAKAISDYTDSDYGVGITGKLNRVDKNNPFGEDNVVYASIYQKKHKVFFNIQMDAIFKSRQENKEKIIEEIQKMLVKII